LQEIFSFMTLADQVAIPLSRNPFYFEINELATQFVKDCHYYDQKASDEFTQNKYEPTEFMNEFRTFAISPCDDTSAIIFLTSLQKKLIPQSFQENSYLQESLTDLTVVLKKLIEYNNRRHHTSEEGSMAAKVLLERVHCFKNRLDESLQRGNVRWGFWKSRRFRHGHLFTTLVQFLWDKIYWPMPGNIPKTVFEARSRAKSTLRPISAEAIELEAQTKALIEQLSGGDCGGLHRSVQDLTQFHHATKESYVASLIVVSGVLSFFTAIIFTIGNIGVAASDNTLRGFDILTNIASVGFGFITPITALLSMFHLARKLFVLFGLSKHLSTKLPNGTDVQKETIRIVRSVTRTQELSVVMRFCASTFSAISLYWGWAARQPEITIGTRPLGPAHLAAAALILHVISIIYLIFIEYFIRYKFDPKLGEHLSESFRGEIGTIFDSFAMPTLNTVTKQEQEALTWEYVSREFVHRYRFDTVFAADRFSALYHFLQSGLSGISSTGKKNEA